MLHETKNTKKGRKDEKNFSFFSQKLYHVADKLPKMLHQKREKGETKREMLNEEKRPFIYSTFFFLSSSCICKLFLFEKTQLSRATPATTFHHIAFLTFFCATFLNLVNNFHATLMQLL